jgi:hypothetical protein
VRGLLNSLRSQETPLGSSTSVKDPRDKTTPLGKQPMREEAFRVKEMEKERVDEDKAKKVKQKKARRPTHGLKEEKFHAFNGDVSFFT